MDAPLLRGEHNITPGAAQLPDLRPYSDDELTRALRPFVLDYLARILQARQRHGFDGAEMLGAARLARFYAILHAACSEAVDKYRREGAA